MAKAPVVRVPTNPSLKAGVNDGLIVRLSSRRSLNWALALTVPDLQSVRQQTCSDYLLPIPLCFVFLFIRACSRKFAAKIIMNMTIKRKPKLAVWKFISYAVCWLGLREYTYKYHSLA